MARPALLDSGDLAGVDGLLVVAVRVGGAPELHDGRSHKLGQGAAGVALSSHS